MSVITFSPTTAGSGYSGGWNDNWTTARNLTDGLNTSAGVMPIVYAGNYGSTPIYQIYRGFTNFYTAGIGSDSTISSARLLITCTVAFNVDSTSLDVVAGTQASTSTLANADYDQAGSTVFGTKALSAITNGVQFAIDLDANGIANISKTGYSKFAFRIARDTANSSPTGKNELSFTAYSLEVTTAADLHAYGGSISTSGGYTIHSFTVSDNFVVPTGMSGSVEALVVAGGGGGGTGIGGGGGGGGLVYHSAKSVSAGSYTVTIGSGGSGGTSAQHGANGGNSVFGDITATGGGGGGGSSGTQNGVAGGSGGGASYAGTTGAAANQGNSGGGTGFGFKGGDANIGGAGNGTGGGGGAGSVGGNESATDNGGAGGSGKTYTISGSSVAYSGGGGGAAPTAGGGVAGSGTDGGGNGGKNANGSAGTANRGGGGGGGSDTQNGGAGGSGVVIVRYLTGSLSRRSFFLTNFI